MCAIRISFLHSFPLQLFQWSPISKMYNYFFIIVLHTHEHTHTSVYIKTVGWVQFSFSSMYVLRTDNLGLDNISRKFSWSRQNLLLISCIYSLPSGGAWGDLHCHESPETGVVILWSNLGNCVLDMSTAPLPCKEKLYFIGNILILLCL